MVIFLCFFQLEKLEKVKACREFDKKKKKLQRGKKTLRRNSYEKKN